jgi:FKBP-type peptidyl-prolyl cis-trans isomerase (trigger factor)
MRASTNWKSANNLRREGLSPERRFAMAQNHFENLIGDLENATTKSTPVQLADRLVEGICQQMQQSGNQQTQQLGQELKTVKPQITKTFQQQAA